mmetsp:Transcript_92730/g.247970  ORF Transcript_92730/g.247970 Transcript_92730/m.247970 type:complete len:331 (+) Transcript_92730:899-1891(+)
MPVGGKVEVHPPAGGAHPQPSPDVVAGQGAQGGAEPTLAGEGVDGQLNVRQCHIQLAQELDLIVLAVRRHPDPPRPVPPHISDPLIRHASLSYELMLQNGRHRLAADQSVCGVHEDGGRGREPLEAGGREDVPLGERGGRQDLVPGLAHEVNDVHEGGGVGDAAAGGGVVAGLDLVKVRHPHDHRPPPRRPRVHLPQGRVPHPLDIRHRRGLGLIPDHHQHGLLCRGEGLGQGQLAAGVPLSQALVPGPPGHPLHIIHHRMRRPQILHLLLELRPVIGAIQVGQLGIDHLYHLLTERDLAQAGGPDERGVEGPHGWGGCAAGGGGGSAPV